MHGQSKSNASESILYLANIITPEILIENGAAINAGDEDENTPLHFVVGACSKILKTS